MRNRVLTDQNNVFSLQLQEAIELGKSKLVLAQATQKKNFDRSVNKECSFFKNDLVLLKIDCANRKVLYEMGRAIHNS